MTYDEFEEIVSEKKNGYLNNEIFHEPVTTNAPGHTVKDIGSLSDDQVEVVLHKRYSYPVMHDHAYIELVYVMSGTCTHFVEQLSFQMKQGDVCILAPNAMHAIAAEADDAVLVNIMMSKKMFDASFLRIVKGGSVISDFLEHILYNQQVSPYLLFPTGNDTVINNLIWNMYEERERKDYLYNESVLLSIKQMFIHLIRNYEMSAIVSNPIDHSHENHVVALMAYINVNYNHVTLKQTAQFFGYNENYLGKMIQRYTGKKFCTLVSDIQMKNAKRLLEETNMSITEVGHEIGCYDTSHFNRKFKAAYGMTPNEFRKQLKECNCSGQDEAFTAESVRKRSDCKNRAILHAKHCPIHRNYEGTE